MASRENELLPDHDLTDRARHGSRAAFDELYRRYGAVTWRLALVVTRDPSIAAGAVAQAFATTLGGNHPPHTSSLVRAELLAAVRRAAADGTAGRGPATRVGPAQDGRAVRMAFAGLPERSRSALWLVDLERLPVAEVGVTIGLPSASVPLLAARARVGLAEWVVEARAREATTEACRRSVELLGDYAAGRLTPRVDGRVRRHLDDCAACRDFLAELDDLAPALRGVALPLPSELAPVAVHRWLAALVHKPGPLGLTWLGGRAVPAWAERTVAGAAAAVITLGIASAILMAGRGGQVRDDRLARQATSSSPVRITDGESALGDEGDSDDPSGGDDGTPATSTTSPPAGGSPSTTTPRSSSAATTPPGTAGSTTGPGSAPRPSTSAPPPAGSGPSAPSPTSPPTTAPPAGSTPAAAEITVGVGGVLGLTVGDQCTGLELLGVAVGCTPNTTGAPIEVNLGGSLLPNLKL